MYLKSLNRASNLAKAIAERKPVPQLGKNLWNLILFNILIIFNNIGIFFKVVVVTLKLLVLLKGPSVVCKYYNKNWYPLNIIGIWFHPIFTYKLLLTWFFKKLIFLRPRSCSRREIVLWKRRRSSWAQIESWSKKSHWKFSDFLLQFNSRTARFAFFNAIVKKKRHKKNRENNVSCTGFDTFYFL